MIWLIIAAFLFVIAGGLIVILWPSGSIYGVIAMSLACVLLLGYILSLFWQKIRDRLKLWRAALVKKFKVCVEKLAEELSILVTNWKNETNPIRIRLLSPIVDIEGLRPYINRLKSAVDQDDAHNIALTGTYGSGKSSILRTFQRCYPNYKYTNISLASFVETGTRINPDDQVAQKHFEEQLEYSILQQLFYQVSARKIPASRFGRIERQSLTRRLVYTISALLLILLSVYLFRSDVIENVLRMEDVDIPLWVHGGFVVAFVFLVAAFLFMLVATVNRISIKTLKVNQATVELENKKDVSIMNRYTDELMYLFKERGFQIVIFEDIDRFDDTQIFTKLRELNILLNNSEEIKQRVVFIYALRDDIFADEKQRTKFFDYIVPVIPYVNVSNSSNIFCREFKKLNIPADKLPAEFIADISVYVNDMRVIMNMVTEFQLYRDLLDDKIDVKKLLAMILFKNLYPKDFADLHKNEGVVYETFASKTNLISTRRKVLEDEIAAIDERLEAISEERLASIHELNAVVVGTFLTSISSSGSYVDENNNSYTNSTIIQSDLAVESILKGAIRYRNIYGNWNSITTNWLKENLPSFDYFKRKKLIETKQNGEINRLQAERAQLVSQKNALDNTQLVDLVKSGIDVFQEVTTLHSDDKEFEEKYAKLKSLLEKGYIDEQYFYYISLYQEGRMTPHDNEYISGLHFGDPKDCTYKLDEPQSVLPYLVESVLSKPQVVNISLLDYLLGHDKDYHDILTTVLTHVGNKVQNGDVDFLYAYVAEGKLIGKFVRKLCEMTSVIWYSLYMDEKHTPSDKASMLKRIFNNVSIEYISKQNEKCAFASFINDYAEYPDLFEGLKEEKRKRIMDTIQLKVNKIIDDSNKQKTMPYLVTHNGYVWSIENIGTIFSARRLPQDNLKSAPYTIVRKSGITEMVEYLQCNLEIFVLNVLGALKTISEEESSMLELLNSEQLTIEQKKPIVDKQADALATIEKISNKEIFLYLYEQNKVKPSLTALQTYINTIGVTEVDDLLCRHINTNGSAYVKIIQGMEGILEPNEDLLRMLYMSTKVSDDVANAILDNPHLQAILPDPLIQLPEGRLHHMIETGRVSFSTTMSDAISKTYPSLWEEYMCKHKDEVIANISKLTLTNSQIMVLCMCAEFAAYKQQLVNQITAERIDSEEIAKFVLDHISLQHGVIEIGTFTKALSVCTDNDVKYSALKRYVDEGLLTVDNTPTVVAVSGTEFEPLLHEGEYLELDMSGTSHALMESLNAKYIVGKINEKDGKYSAYVKKRTR